LWEKTLSKNACTNASEHTIIVALKMPAKMLAKGVLKMRAKILVQSPFKMATELTLIMPDKMIA
jgi:hypothetical protein